MTSSSNNKINRGARHVFLLCVLAYTAIYIGRKNFSVCLSEMLASGFIDKVIGGSAGTSFLIAYAVGQVVSGILSDRISPRIMITVGLCGAGAANIGMAINPFPALVPVIWCICGAFCSMLWASIIKCIAEWLPADRIEKAGVDLSITVPLGSIITYLIASVTLGISGWRQVFIICGVVCIASGLFFCMSVGRLSGYFAMLAVCEESDKASANDKTHERKHSLIGFLLSACMLLIILSVMCNGVLKDGLDLWTPTFLSEFFSMSSSASAMLMSFIPLLNFAGAHFSKFFYDRFRLDEMSVTALMYIIAVIAFVPVCIITACSVSGAIALTVSIALLAIIMMATTGANTMLMTFIPFRYKKNGKTAGISGILNACSYAGAALSGITVGFVAESSGWSLTIISFAAISLLGATISFLCIRPWKQRCDNV